MFFFLLKVGCRKRKTKKPLEFRKIIKTLTDDGHAERRVEKLRWMESPPRHGRAV